MNTEDIILEQEVPGRRPPAPRAPLAPAHGTTATATGRPALNRGRAPPARGPEQGRGEAVNEMTV